MILMRMELAMENKTSETLIEFNVNDCVMVKLTDVGIAELRNQHEGLIEVFPSIKTIFNPPKTDDDGFSKWQLHSLMSTFGHMMTPGFQVPFETTIKIIKNNNQQKEIK
jgi:hypothetical protein